MANAISNFVNWIANGARQVVLDPMVDLWALAAKGINKGLDLVTWDNLSQYTNPKIDKAAEGIKAEATSPVDPTSTAYAVWEWLVHWIDNAAMALWAVQLAKQWIKNAPKMYNKFRNWVSWAKNVAKKSDWLLQNAANVQKELWQSKIDLSDTMMDYVKTNHQNMSQKEINDMMYKIEQNRKEWESILKMSAEEFNKRWEKEFLKSVDNYKIWQDFKAERSAANKSARDAWFKNFKEANAEAKELKNLDDLAKKNWFKDYSEAADNYQSVVARWGNPNLAWMTEEDYIKLHWLGEDAEINATILQKNWITIPKFQESYNNVKKSVDNIAKMSNKEFVDYMGNIERASMEWYSPYWYDYRLEDSWHAASSTKDFNKLKSEIIDWIMHEYWPEWSHVLSWEDLDKIKKWAEKMFRQPVVNSFKSLTPAERAVMENADKNTTSALKAGWDPQVEPFDLYF